MKNTRYITEAIFDIDDDIFSDTEKTDTISVYDMNDIIFQESIKYTLLSYIFGDNIPNKEFFMSQMNISLDGNEITIHWKENVLDKIFLAINKLFSNELTLNNKNFNTFKFIFDKKIVHDITKISSTYFSSAEIGKIMNKVYHAIMTLDFIVDVSVSLNDFYVFIENYINTLNGFVVPEYESNIYEVSSQHTAVTYNTQNIIEPNDIKTFFTRVGSIYKHYESYQYIEFITKYQNIKNGDYTFFDFFDKTLGKYQIVVNITNYESADIKLPWGLKDINSYIEDKDLSNYHHNIIEIFDFGTREKIYPNYNIKYQCKINDNNKIYRRRILAKNENANDQTCRMSLHFSNKY